MLHDSGVNRNILCGGSLIGNMKFAILNQYVTLINTNAKVLKHASKERSYSIYESGMKYMPTIKIDPNSEIAIMNVST